MTTHTKLNILIVEDNAFQQKISTHIIESMGHEAIIACNGSEAINSAKESFDLIIMDIGLPGSGPNGIEATKIIRETNTETIIIALSAHINTELSNECLESGMNHILTKPLDTEKLKFVINEFLS